MPRARRKVNKTKPQQRPMHVSFHVLGTRIGSAAPERGTGGVSVAQRTSERARVRAYASRVFDFIENFPVRACACVTVVVDDGILWIIHSHRGQADVFIMIKLVVSGGRMSWRSAMRLRCVSHGCVWWSLALAEKTEVGFGISSNRCARN